MLIMNNFKQITMETKFVWRLEKPKVYVAKVIYTCEKRSGVNLGENIDILCRDCNRIVPTEHDEVNTLDITNPVVNNDNEIEITSPKTNTDEIKELVDKYNKEVYCQCETSVEQTSMFEIESVCIRCEKIIKKI